MGPNNADGMANSVDPDQSSVCTVFSPSIKNFFQYLHNNLTFFFSLKKPSANGLTDQTFEIDIEEHERDEVSNL